ncbi:SDR family oxidoreductase [Kibdelosporangium persicum]|uniref:NADP-dependent 3-hydroxy acid dehydrogenase YdfG n=1 Tax=Kibdelosporangium persicum TaxID=2698649 RepID=A0ABX2FCY4_9PSEU|nr:SDR family oxidoreductase [Kibdelosporangium persicum]NRN68762.1 NADP-dependent 3-hydroxy acid dehydrogenase YdfG [Kibdelosporangium persicum]
MDIKGVVALVTGANRGIGRHFVQQLLERGATKVYATARNPERVDIAGAHVLQLDVTDPSSVAAAAAASPDVTLLINNAGVSLSQNYLDGNLDDIRLELETLFWGTLNTTRAFAPVLAANGGGAVLNVLSAMSWFSYDGANSYASAKAAQWALTNGTRLELARQGTLVTALHMGLVDTDMAAGYDVDKLDPADVVRTALDGVAAGALEILVDDASRQVKAALALDPSALYPQTAAAA